MSDPDLDSGADPLLPLAEEFAERFRRGERPGLSEYDDRYPELAERIRKLFPALAMIEVLGSVEEGVSATGEVSPATAWPARVPPALGDYQILREIGRGGMGVVYEAEQVSLGRRVALKVLPRNALHDDKALQRFRREARAAARLHHTNIVPVFEVGQEGGVCYYAMQFIAGQGLDLVIDEIRKLRARPRSGVAIAPIGTPREKDSLRAQQFSRAALSLLDGGLEWNGPHGEELATTQAGDGQFLAQAAEGTPVAEAMEQPADAAGSSSLAVLPCGADLSTAETGRRQPYYWSIARIGQQVAGALAYAHGRGILHRDIKPSNLLLDGSGVVWITDFGLAKTDEEGLTRTGDVLGTLRYMAPERFRGEGDARADVYALGLTLYELLALKPAFDTPDRLRLIEQIKAEQPACLRSLDRLIPRDLETIVVKAIDKDASRRYQSADELGEDLRRFQAGEPILARRSGWIERTWRWARRNPAVASLLLLTALLLAGVAVGSSVAAYRLDGLRREADLHAAESEAVQSFLGEDLFGAAARQSRGGKPLGIADVLTLADSRIDKKFPDQPLVEASIRETLGRVHYALGECKLAEHHFESAYELRHRMDPKHRYTIAALELLALAAVACDDAEKLGSLEQETLKLVADPDRAYHTLGLVDAYSIHHRPERARALLERILSEDRLKLGDHHPITLWDEMNLAFVVRNMNLPDQAMAIAQSVLEAGPIASRSANLGTLHREVGRRRLEVDLARARVLLRNASSRSRNVTRAPTQIDAPLLATTPIADGVISENEYGLNPGLRLDFTSERGPWRLLVIGRSRTATLADLSVTLYAAHTQTCLFMAFRVHDQVVNKEVTMDPAYRDHVELFIDGDRMPNDFYIARGNREGFFLQADPRGIQRTWALDFSNIDLTVGTGMTSDGYVVEFQIPLDLIDTQDGPDSRPPGTGSTLLINAAIVDNDRESRFEQEHYAVLYTDEPALSPFWGGEDTWVVPLRLTPGSE